MGATDQPVPRSPLGAFGRTMPPRTALLAIALAFTFALPGGALVAPVFSTHAAEPHAAASALPAYAPIYPAAQRDGSSETWPGGTGVSRADATPLPSGAPVPPTTLSSFSPQSLGNTQLAAAEVSLAQGQGPAAEKPSRPASLRTSTAATDPPSSTGTERPLTPQTSSGSTWSQLQTPLPWTGVSMAYDGADGYMLEFGGSANGQYSGTTWEFVAGVWTQLAPTLSPAAREGASMTYDAADGYILLFGGSNGAASLSDTWEFRAGQWTLLQPTTAPSARSGASMAYDAADGYVVLFGGVSRGGADLGDTWEYKAGVWTLLSPGGAPSARTWASMSYDSSGGYVLLMGGSTSHTEADTWSFLAGTWTNISTTAGSPGARTGAAMTYDGADHYIVLFGGASHGLLSDTWKFTGGTWTSLSAAGPSGRLEAGLAYDSFHQETILFGGVGAGQPQSVESWTTWNFGNDQWSEFSPGGAPSPRSEFSMVWDGADGYVLLFGGISGATYLGDTWSFKGGRWAEIESAQATAGQCTQISNGATVSCPVPRAAMSMTWDGFDNDVALFGGFNGGDLGDTWKFTGGSWTELEVVGSGGTCNVVGGGTGASCPSPREWAAFADYYPNVGYAVLFGGDASNTVMADTWEFQWGGWTQLSPSAHPPARYGAAVATEYSSGTGYVLLFGGWGTGNSLLSDTWEYGWQAGGPNWVQQSPTTHPSARGYANLADGNPAVLFGGDTGLAAVDDTWSYASGQWTQVASLPSSPNVRNSLGIVDDTTDGYYVLFGGAYLVSAYGDTWTYGSTLTGTTPTATRAQVELGQGVSFTTGASGGGSGSYAYHWGGLPPGCVPSGTSASIACTPSGAGSYYVNSVVSDSDGNVPATSSSVAVTVYGDPTTTTPTGSPWSVDEGQQVTFSTSTAGGTGTYTWTWSGLPSGCSLANSSAITCTPTASGPSSVKVGVKDTNGFTASSGTLAYAVVGDPSVGTPSATRFSVDVNQPVTYGAAPTGGASSYYRYVWNGLPSGCATANATSLPCTPSSVGTYTVGVTVSDANGFAVASPPLSFLVHANPSITLAENRTVLDLGESLTLWGNASGGSGTYSIWYQGLPCGSANTSTLVCVPTATGTFTVTAHVNDTLGGSSTSGGASFIVYLDPVVIGWFARGGPVAYANRSLILQVNYSQGNPLYRPCVDAPGSTLGGISCGAWQGGPNYPFGFWYTQPGTYSITASVEDSTGWNTTLTLTETVYWPLAPAPSSLPSVVDNGMTANGTATLIHGIPGFSIWLNDTTAGGGVCSTTDPSDGTVVCAFVPAWTGSHTIETTVRDSGGMAWSANSTLLVNPALHRLYLNVTVGAYSASKGGTLQDEVGATTTFDAAFAGGTGLFTETWSYNGSITMGGGASLSYAWSHAGTYTVTFVIKDSLGRSISGALTVQVNPTATNLVLASHLSQLDIGTQDNLTLNFSGGLTPFSYSWNFGDGTTASSGHPWVLHAWASAGPFTVTVTLTDGAGTQLQTTVRVAIVADPQVLNVTAEFGTSVRGAGGTLSAYPNGTVSFAGFFSGGIGPYRLSWTANGTPIKTQQGSGPWFNATQVWTGPGNYRIAFSVTDAEGQASTASLWVVIHPDLLVGAAFAATWSTVDVGAPDNLTLAFQGGLGPFTYSWNLGDGSTPTTNVPWTTHAWSSAGSYMVKVSVHDSLAASISASIVVTAVPSLSVACAPKVNATVVWAGEPLSLALACTTNGTSPYSFFWEFGDSGTLASGSPSAPYAFDSAGNYSVRVLVNDTGGDSVLSRTLMIEALTVAEVTPVIEGASYVVDSASANGPWKEVRVTLTLEAFTGSSTISSWRLAGLASSLAGAPWRQWGALTVVVNVTSVNATQLVFLQLEDALGRTSAPYAANLNLSNLFAQGPGGGGNGGLSIGELFLFGTALVILALAAILGVLVLSRRRRTGLSVGGSAAPGGSPEDKVTPGIRTYLGENPGATATELVEGVSKATGGSPDEVQAKVHILIYNHQLVESRSEGEEPTYTLAEEAQKAVSPSSSPAVTASVDEDQEGLRRDAVLNEIANLGSATEVDLAHVARETGMSRQALHIMLGTLEVNDRLIEHSNGVDGHPHYSLSLTGKAERAGRAARVSSVQLELGDAAVSDHMASSQSNGNGSKVFGT